MRRGVWPARLAEFRQNGVESTFFKRGEQFMVCTGGPDGKLADYEVCYTFGVYPLQQSLIDALRQQ